MKVIVFYDSYEQGKRKLLEILEGKECEKLVISKTECFAMLTDGSYYKACRISDNALGQKADKIYIQHGIDDEIFNSIIMPTLGFPKLPKSEQIEYY